MSDDFLDDLDPSTVGQTYKVDYTLKPGGSVVSGVRGGKSGRQAPEPPPGYFVVPGGGSTFEARGHLKALGGRWHPEAYCWYMPDHARAETMHALNEATVAKSLHANPDDVAAVLNKNAPIKGQVPASLYPTLTCWECGGPLYAEGARKAMHFASPPAASLKQGAVVADAYCGCIERGDKPKAVGRPNFRQR